MSRTVPNMFPVCWIGSCTARPSCKLFPKKMLVVDSCYDRACTFWVNVVAIEFCCLKHIAYILPCLHFIVFHRLRTFAFPKNRLWDGFTVELGRLLGLKNCRLAVVAARIGDISNVCNVREPQQNYPFSCYVPPRMKNKTGGTLPAGVSLTGGRIHPLGDLNGCRNKVIMLIAVTPL